MAIINLKDVTVTRLNGKGNGLKVTESNESKGKTYKTQYTIWFDAPSGLQVGDVVSLSGFLAAKVGEPWTGDDGHERRSVELSVNAPRLSDDTRHPAVPAQPAADTWASDDSAPF